MSEHCAGALVATEFSTPMVGDGSTDNTAAWNACIAYCNANSIGALHIPDGKYVFASRPDAIDFPLTVKGDGYYRTALIRNYTPGNADDYFLKIAWSYVHFQLLDIQAGDGTSGGRAVECVLASSPASYGNWCFHRLVRVIYEVGGSGTGTWKHGWYLDGEDSASGNGLRDWEFNNCYVFAATTAGVFAKSVRQFGWHGGMCGDFALTGTSGDISQNVVLSPLAGGVLTTEHVKGLHVTGPWNGGTIGSTTDNFCISITGDVPFTVNSPDGYYCGQAASFTGPIKSNASNVTVADDAVTTFAAPANAQLILVSSGSNVGALLGFFRSSGAVSRKLLDATGHWEVSNSVLAGTTGTDGKVNVSLNSGTFYIENRLGASASFAWSIFNTDG